MRTRAYIPARLAGTLEFARPQKTGREFEAVTGSGLEPGNLRGCISRAGTGKSPDRLARKYPGAVIRARAVRSPAFGDRKAPTRKGWKARPLDQRLAVVAALRASGVPEAIILTLTRS